MYGPEPICWNWRKKSKNVEDSRLLVPPCLTDWSVFKSQVCFTPTDTCNEGEGNTDGGNKTASSNMIKGGPEIPE